MQGSHMKTLFKSFVLGAALTIAAGAMAAAPPDPALGTWTLNVTKSTFGTFPAPKSQTRTYAADADGIALTISGVEADGTAISQASTFKYDGKAYNFTGSPLFDAITLKRVNGSTVRASMLKAGKPVGTATRSISGHGKVLTLTTKGTSAKGQAYQVVEVYDKQ